MRTEGYIVQIKCEIKPYRFYNTFVHLVIIFMAIQIVIAYLASYMHIPIYHSQGALKVLLLAALLICHGRICRYNPTSKRPIALYSIIVLYCTVM